MINNQNKKDELISMDILRVTENESQHTELLV